MSGLLRSTLLLLALVGSLCGAEPVAGARLRVAAISFVPVKLDVARNADRSERDFRQAAAGGARLAVAPEGVLEGTS